MPLDASVLKGLVWNALQAKGCKEIDKTKYPDATFDVKDISDAIVDTLIPYIQANAVVNTSVAVVVATVGGPTAQTGTGTGTGVGTIQ